MTPTPADPPTDLDAILAQIVQEAEAGRLVDAVSWAERYPRWRLEVLEFCGDLGYFATFLGLSDVPDPNLTLEYRSRPYPPAGTVPPIPIDGPTRFGEYDLLRAIGVGGMGEVFRARRRDTELVVALKRLREWPKGAGLPAGFTQEVNAVAGLKHPHIVPIYHVGEHDGRAFFTMELLEGGSLQDALPRLRADRTAAVRLLIKVARAVHHAHQRGIVHRDLKPANILLDEQGEPRVADFGLATRIDAAGTADDAGPPAGSLPWMAPEAVRGDTTLTTAVDVWALGVILYELLTGVRPFVGTDPWAVRSAILEAEPVAPRLADRRVPRDLDAICRRCLRKDPDQRYESASALALDLERWLRDEPVRARRAGRAERFARWCRRHPALAGGTALLVVLLLTGSVAALLVAAEQEARLRSEVSRGNEFAARHVASTILWRLEQLGEAVMTAADDPALHQTCVAGDWTALEGLLKRRMADVPALATMYVLDPTGTIRAEWPQYRKVVGENFCGRDYFAGALRHAGRDGHDRVHLSRVFRSRNDGLDKLAISVPLQPAGPGTPVWVLGATIPTDSTLGLDGLHDERRKAVLLAARDANPADSPPATAAEPPEFLILVHPAYEARQQSVPFPHAKLRPVPTPSGEPELRLPSSGLVFEADDDYTDPVAGSHPEYAGRWLAGFAPVGNTELVVLIQQRYDEAVAPHRTFFRRFLAWLGGAVALGVALVGALWLAGSRRRSIA